MDITFSLKKIAILLVLPSLLTLSSMVCVEDSYGEIVEQSTNNNESPEDETSCGCLVDRVMAVANDEIITLSDLNKEGEAIFQQIKEHTSPSELDTALKIAHQEVLSNLIDKIIIRQRAEQLDISVNDDEVDKAIERILTKNNKTVQEFRHELRTRGTNEEDYRSTLRDQILASKLINYEIRSKIVITDKKIEEYYHKYFTDKNSRDGFHILQIGFVWDAQDELQDKDELQSKEKAKERAEEVRQLAADGRNFNELAKTYSDLPSAMDGGDIGVFNRDELAFYMRDIILAMQPGEISPIVETPSGFQFFKLLSAKEGDIITQVPYESAKEEIRDLLHQEEMKQQYDKWVKELREQAYIKQLL